ncbi:MAG: HEAT repeat domain-containing protein [Dehalococcoidia bacterium]|nr:HEAT repeat domain-containing protein [Dehalococcoidia bacterium]
MKFTSYICLLLVTLGMTACLSETELINRLVPQLSDPDPLVATQTYDRMAEIGGLAVVPMINALESNDNTDVRCAAAWALGQSGDDRAIAPLIGALDDTDEEVGQWAAGALQYIGGPAVTPLITALKAEATMTRIAAAEILGQIKASDAVVPLIEALGNNDSVLRQMSAVALANIRVERAAVPLVAALKDSDGAVRSAAVEALVNIGLPAVKPLISALYDGVSYVIQEDGTLLEIRQEAAMALGRIGDSGAVQPLATALQDADPYFSWDAAGALALIGPPAVDTLIPLLTSIDSQIVRKAAWTLGQIGAPRAMEPLITVMKYGDNPGGQAAFQALSAMGEASRGKLEAFLVKALQAQDLKVIAAGYDFYILKGDVSAEPALIAAMNLYADAYGNYDDNGLVAIAERFLNCGNEKLRAAAIGWANGKAFQIMVTPADKVAETWGRGVYDAYCGDGMVTWGNNPIGPSEVYILWRGIIEAPGFFVNDGPSSLSGGNRPSGIGRGSPGTVIVYAGGGPRSIPGYSGRSAPGCPDISWKVETLTGSDGFKGKPVVYEGDRMEWHVTLTKVRPRDRINIKIVTKMDGVIIDERMLGIWREYIIAWLPRRGWTAESEKLHNVVFEISRENMLCDSQGWQFPVVKKPLDRPQSIDRPQWLRPRLIDGWQSLSPLPVNRP